MAVSLHYDLYDSPRPAATLVILLHGLGSCGEDWALQLPALRPHFRVLTLDLPGHGRSPMPAGWPRVEDFARAIEELLETLGVARGHVVGLSLGGAVALRLALERPDFVASLVAVNTFARLRLANTGRLAALRRIALLTLGRMDALGHLVAEGLFPEPGQEMLRQAAAARLAANTPGNYLRAILAATRYDLRARLSEIQAPTLVVAGLRDTTIPLEAKTALADAIPGARLAILPHSGHASPLDATQAFNTLLLEFLQDQQP